MYCRSNPLTPGNLHPTTATLALAAQQKGLPGRQPPDHKCLRCCCGCFVAGEQLAVSCDDPLDRRGRQEHDYGVFAGENLVVQAGFILAETLEH